MASFSLPPAVYLSDRLQKVLIVTGGQHWQIQSSGKWNENFPTVSMGTDLVKRRKRI